MTITKRTADGDIAQVKRIKTDQDAEITLTFGPDGAAVDAPGASPAALFAAAMSEKAAYESGHASHIAAHDTDVEESSSDVALDAEDHAVMVQRLFEASLEAYQRTAPTAAAQWTREQWSDGLAHARCMLELAKFVGAPDMFHAALERVKALMDAYSLDDAELPLRMRSIASQCSLGMFLVTWKQHIGIHVDHDEDSDDDDAEEDDEFELNAELRRLFERIQTFLSEFATGLQNITSEVCVSALDEIYALVDAAVRFVTLKKLPLKLRFDFLSKLYQVTSTLNEKLEREQTETAKHAMLTGAVAYQFAKTASFHDSNDPAVSPALSALELATQSLSLFKHALATSESSDLSTILTALEQIGHAHMLLATLVEGDDDVMMHFDAAIESFQCVVARDPNAQSPVTERVQRQLERMAMTDDATETSQ